MRSRKGSFPERVFERALWATRYIMVVAVVAIVVLAVVSFYYALGDLTYLLSLAADYASLAPSERPAARDEGVTTVVKVLDGFFIGALLLVVAAGLYELFVGRIEGGRDLRGGAAPAEDLVPGRPQAARRQAGGADPGDRAVPEGLRLPYDSALEILYLAAAIALVSGSLYLIGRGG